ncbi:MAG: hypothetical protein JWN30_1826 [Bacilli bacterium]|nr:hypothetical protein [Bacilli bacterium]
MSKYQLKELKQLRPSLKKYPASAKRAKKRQALHEQTFREYSGVTLLLAVIISLLVLPHLTLAGVPASAASAAASGASGPTASGYTSVHAQAGASAWSLIQSVNVNGVDMEEALSRFRALNGTVNIKEGFTYKVPVIP